MFSAMDYLPAAGLCEAGARVERGPVTVMCRVHTTSRTREFMTSI